MTDLHALALVLAAAIGVFVALPGDRGSCAGIDFCKVDHAAHELVRFVETLR